MMTVLYNVAAAACIMFSIHSASEALLDYQIGGLSGGEPNGTCSDCGPGGLNCTAANPGRREDFVGDSCSQPGDIKVFCNGLKGQKSTPSETTKAVLTVNPDSDCPMAPALICAKLQGPGAAWISTADASCGKYSECIASSSVSYSADDPKNPCKKPTPKPKGE